MITIEQMHFSRDGRVIFDGVDLRIETSKITAIMGPSGTGKTTLLHLIGAQLTPDSGTIDVNGRNIHQLSTNELYAERRKMGLLFQSAALFTNLSVFENVAFPLREHTDLDDRLIRHIVLMKLQAVGLRGAQELMSSQLSGGMARRVAIARAIALDPQLMMYDEPFAGQDPISLGVLVQLIHTLNQALNTTTIVVSHDVPETLSIADYVYILSGGQVVGEGTPEQLRRDDNPHVQQFINGMADGAVPFHYPAVDYYQELLNV